MRKLISLLMFAGGTAFGALFATKRGEEVRKELGKKKSREEQAEVLGKEAQAMAKNFWKAVKGPLKKLVDDAKKELTAAGKEVQSKAKKKAKEEIAIAKRKIKGAMSKAKKKVTKKAKTSKRRTKK